MMVDSGPPEGQAWEPPDANAGSSADDPERSLRERFVRTRPEPPPTDIVALRTRIAAASRYRTSQSSPHPRTSPTKVRGMVRTAACLAAVAGLALLVSPFRPTPTAAMTVLQDAQEALERTKSVSFEMSAVEAGKRLNLGPVRIRILAPGRVRVEEPGGNYSVTDLKTGKSLRVVPGAKRAQLIERTADPGEAGLVDFYEFFRRIDQKKTRDLPSRTIGEVEAIGFEAVVGDPFGKGNTAVQYIRGWLHPKTKLPLRLEHEPKFVHSYGMGPVPTVVCENFVFDEPLDPDLFSLEPPKGYKIAP
jgi:outer membrane lipoprotein-sorting protein